MIFHSDRGRQYLYALLNKLQNKYGILTSMGNKAWENGHTERINGVLKGEYINFLVIDDLKQMKKRVKSVISLYNRERPHGSLKMKTPQEFENFVQGPVPEQRPVFNINYELKKATIFRQGHLAFSGNPAASCEQFFLIKNTVKVV